jgi:hypothetical protein
MKILILLTTIFLTTSAHADRTFSGLYEVPEVVGQDFENLNTFKVRYRMDDSATKIRYRLPLELTGVEQSVEIEKTIDKNGNEIWVGEKAVGTCGLSNSTFACQLEYRNLEFDPDNRLQVIQDRIQDLREQNLRLNVAIHFESEPIGVISYKIRRQK